MNFSQKPIANKKYLSLKQAAQIFGYSPDHLGFLIRQKKLKGKKIYSEISWQITPQELIEYCKKIKNKNLKIKETSSDFKKKKYISLKEAAEISGYHPDYVGYLLRTGKLKGKKIASNFLLTTEEKDIKNYLLKKAKLKKFPQKKSNKKERANIISWGFFSGNFNYRPAIAVILILTLLESFFPIGFFPASLKKLLKPKNQQPLTSILINAI